MSTIQLSHLSHSTELFLLLSCSELLFYSVIVQNRSICHGVLSVCGVVLSAIQLAHCTESLD